MTKSFKLYGLNVEVIRCDGKINTYNYSSTKNADKNNLLYQFGLIENYTSGEVKYSFLDFRFQRESKELPGLNYLWFLNKIKASEVEYNHYSPDQIKILASFIKYALRINGHGEIYSVKMLELLIRGLRDEELVNYFYNYPGGDYSIFFESRASSLMGNPGNYKFANELPVERFQRQRYSVYRLMKDLVRYKAEISTDLTKYEYITAGGIEVPKEVAEKKGDYDWFPITALLGNNTRANLSLMYSGGARCIIRDGNLHTPELAVRVKDKRFLKKLRSSHIITSTLLFNTDVVLDLTKLQLVGPSDCKIKLSEYLDSFMGFRDEKETLMGNYSLIESTVKPKTDETTSYTKRTTRPIETTSYTAVQLCFRYSPKAAETLKTEEEAKEFYNQYRKIVTSQREKTFKVLMSKKLFGISTFDYINRKTRKSVRTYFQRIDVKRRID